MRLSKLFIIGLICLLPLAAWARGQYYLGAQYSVIGNCGTTEIGSATSIGSKITGVILWIKYTHSGASCLYDTVKLYCDDNTSTVFKIGRYADSGGAPTGSVLASTAEIAAPAGYQFAGGAITEFQVDNGGVYWFAFISDGTLSYKYLTGSSGDAYFQGCSYGTFPTVSSPTINDRQANIELSHS